MVVTIARCQVQKIQHHQRRGGVALELYSSYTKPGTTYFEISDRVLWYCKLSAKCHTTATAPILRLLCVSAGGVAAATVALGAQIKKKNRNTGTPTPTRLGLLRSGVAGVSDTGARLPCTQQGQVYLRAPYM